MDSKSPENYSSAEALCDFSRADFEISGDRQALTHLLATPLTGETIGRLFGGIIGSQIKIEKSETGIDIWTSNDWFQSPLYYSLERDQLGIVLTINDFFLKEDAPATLGTRIVAALILQARLIPAFDSILATATRWHFPQNGEELVQEVVGYYFFPRLGFNADPHNAEEYIEIPEKIRGMKLVTIMGDPELRAWWKGNGQTIEVKFKLRGKASLNALNLYLAEKKIGLEK